MPTKPVTKILVVSALFWQGTSFASSSAQAIIDWDKLSFQLIDLSGGKNSPVLNWSSKSGSVTTYASSVTPFDYEGNTRTSSSFNKGITADSETEYAQSNAIRNSNFLYADASSDAGKTTEIKGMNTAFANAENSGNFSLSGMGWLLISMNWSAFSTGDYDGDSLSEPNESAKATVTINGSYNSQFNSGSSSLDYSTLSGGSSKNGIFSMGFANLGVGTTTGYISAIATAFSSSNTRIAKAENISKNTNHDEENTSNGKQTSNEKPTPQKESSSGNATDNNSNHLDETLKYALLGIKPVPPITNNDAPPVTVINLVNNTNSKVPEPATFALIAIGIAGIRSRSSRKMATVVEA